MTVPKAKTFFLIFIVCSTFFSLFVFSDIVVLDIFTVVCELASNRLILFAKIHPSWLKSTC